MTAVEIVALIVNGGVLLGGGAGGAVYGFRRMAARKNSTPPPKYKPGQSLSPDSPTPAALEHERMKAAARAAGYGPGRTDEFGRANSIGELRCNGHQELLNIVTQAKDVAIAAQGAASTAASTAAAATAASIRLEETVRAESAITHEKLDSITEHLTQTARTEGATEARLDSIDRDIGRLLTRGAR